MHLPVVTEPQLPSARVAIDKLNLVLPKLSSVEHVRSCPGLAKMRAYMIDHVEELPEPLPDEWDTIHAKLLDMNASKSTIDWKRQEFVINAIAQIHGDSICPHEQRAVYSLIDQLSQIYDVTDGRIIMIIRELCQQLVISMRVEGVMSDNDLFPLYVGKGGKQFQSTHPSLNAKKEYSKLLVETLKALDDITKNKVSISIEGNGFDMAALLMKIKKQDAPTHATTGEVIVNGN